MEMDASMGRMPNDDNSPGGISARLASPSADPADPPGVNDYDSFAEVYSAQNEVNLHNAYYERPATLALAGDVAGRRILDAGCGSGPLSAALRDRGAIVTGFDKTSGSTRKRAPTGPRRCCAPRKPGPTRACAWTAMAKTARWQDRFAEAAGLAARGFEASGQAPVRAELAYREANAIALFGDAPRARDALQKADRACDGLDDDGTSAWSFSRGRQAIFTLSVCVHTGDPDGALRAAQEADAYWDAGGGKVTATWAQVRAGAAMAHLMKDSLDGAARQLSPVLELPPDQRIRTVTGYLDEISGMIRGGASLAARSPRSSASRSGSSARPA